jgi:hypothetical protein
VGTGPLRTTTVGSQLQHIQTDDYLINSDEIPTNSTTITAPQRARWSFGKKFRQQKQFIGSQNFPIYPSSLAVGQYRANHTRAGSSTEPHGVIYLQREHTRWFS